MVTKTNYETYIPGIRKLLEDRGYGLTKLYKLMGSCCYDQLRNIVQGKSFIQWWHLGSMAEALHIRRDVLGKIFLNYYVENKIFLNRLTLPWGIDTCKCGSFYRVCVMDSVKVPSFLVDDK